MSSDGDGPMVTEPDGTACVWTRLLRRMLGICSPGEHFTGACRHFKTLIEPTRTERLP